MYKIFIKSVLVFLISSSLLFQSHSTKGANASIAFSDNFDRDNSSSLGSNWVLFYGGQPAGIQDNQAYIDVDAGGNWGFYKVSNLDIQDQDVEVTFIHQNGDTTLLARVIDLNNRIAINYYQTGSLQIYEVTGGSYRLIPNTAPNAVIGNVYTIRARIIGSSLKVWVNGTQYADAILNQVTSGSAGFGANDGYTRVLFDNFSIENISPATPSSEPSLSPSSTPSPTNTPSPIPSPTTTATPTPTPTLPILSVPSLKQYSTPWKNKMYDHINGTIEQFGCALTSAIMILQYHGHAVLPDKLNEWLKNQSDGYTRNGLINWLAVSRYTKLNDSLSSPTLEYKRLKPTFENLDKELNNNRPAILKEPGHFIVATGKLTDTYSINDPGYANRNTLLPYNNTFQAINSFTPTHSDLSYMMFVVDSDINIEVRDSSNALVDIETYIDEPINNLKNPNKKSGGSVKTILFEKPETGSYTLKVTGPKGGYQLDSYLYNTNGKVSKNEFKGILKGRDTDTFSISFEGKNKIKEKNNKNNSHNNNGYSNHFAWFKHFFKFFNDRR